METEGEEKPQQVFYRPGDKKGVGGGGWIWRSSGRHEDLQLVHLLPWPEWPVGSQGMAAAAGAWDTAMSGGKRRRWGG
ncbi:hypothetical protein I79_012701 [Cricetulus griseus]|uniref:Uncharacterized protein n=1 Tax=Cricetulus griseus TaxID=10029 RepID=G3HPI8_CRIGR|nr:hypothetical protein I79_012701 [Cricetulus griseus]